MSANKQFPSQVLTQGPISLRTLRESDAPFIELGGSDSETQKWLPLPTPYTLNEANSFIRKVAPATLGAGTGIVFAIEHRDIFVGCIDVKRAEWLNGNCEIGYWTMPEHRGRGFMPMALDLLSRWVLLEQGFVRVEVRVAAQNLSSQRVAEKAGFTREGVARRAGRVHGGRVDLIIYSKVFDDL